MAAKGFTAQVRGLILTRDMERCVRCWTNRWELELHHRQLRSRGGKHVPSNGVTLCQGCHRWVHENPVTASNAGLMVPSWGDPLSVPVRMPFGHLVLLDDTGHTTLVSTPDEP